MDAESGSHGHGQRLVYEMTKEALKGVPSKLTKAIDAVNYVQRLKDIYGYKTIKEFKPPKGANPSQTAAYEKLLNIYHSLTPAERAMAEKAPVRQCLTM